MLYFRSFLCGRFLSHDANFSYLFLVKLSSFKVSKILNEELEKNYKLNKLYTLNYIYI